MFFMCADTAFAVNCKGFGECDIQELQDNGYKCRKFTCEDDGIVGYEVCVPTTGYTLPKFVLNANNESGVGHFEGNKCYSNTRACSKFNVSVTGGSGDWTCKKEYQTGNAQWIDEGNNYTYWRVDACKCKQDNLNVSSAGCVVGHIDHELLTQIISNATTKIPYKQTVRYCGQCAPGKIPKKDSAETNGVKFRPDNPSGNYNWGVYRCENVSVPYYATGCTIDFTQSNFNNVVTGCRAQCSSQYLTITTNGATSADACKPDSTEYTDGIGKFTLGPDSCN